MKRIILFVVTNLALLTIVSVVCAALGVDEQSMGGLLVFSLLLGMGGSIVSLLASKFIARSATGAQVLSGDESEMTGWLVRTVNELAQQAQVGMPEVAIYEGAPNAFATGAFRNNALVAVSTGLMQKMSRAEVRAVLAHEIGHVANGDMVTMTLLQGVLNAAVIMLSRVVGIVVDGAISGKNRRGLGIGYFVTYMVLQFVLGILASLVVMGFSRRREYAADASAARFMGSPSDMIRALQRLESSEPSDLPASVAAFGVTGRERWARLFASHPPLSARIERLQQNQIVM